MTLLAGGSMRTTVVLKDDLVRKAKKLSPETTLSGLLLNNCLADWIDNHTRRKLKMRLTAEYRSARKESRRLSREFASSDKEGWPSW